MAVETAGHLPGHKNILKPVRNALIAAALTGIAITGGVAIRNTLEKDSPSYHVITAEKFGIPPPRGVVGNTSNTTEELPTIKEYRDVRFTPGISFRLEEKPPVEIDYRTPDGGTKKAMRYFPSWLGVHGYLLQKELNPDGSVMLAVEVPVNNEPFSQDDIGKTLLSRTQNYEEGNFGKLNGAIVWLKLESAEGLTGPFTSSFAWYKDQEGFDGFGARRSGRITNIPSEMFKYANIGDPISAVGSISIDFAAQQQLDKDYLEQQGQLAYDEAQKRYQALVDHNASALRQMLDDAQVGNVTLRQQLEEKRYVITTSSADFFPRIS